MVLPYGLTRSPHLFASLSILLSCYIFLSLPLISVPLAYLFLHLWIVDYRGYGLNAVANQNHRFALKQKHSKKTKKQNNEEEKRNNNNNSNKAHTHASNLFNLISRCSRNKCPMPIASIHAVLSSIYHSYFAHFYEWKYHIVLCRYIKLWINVFISQTRRIRLHHWSSCQMYFIFIFIICILVHGSTMMCEMHNWIGTESVSYCVCTVHKWLRLLAARLSLIICHYKHFLSYLWHHLPVMTPVFL